MPVLFPLLTLYTLSYLGLMVYDFVAQEAFVTPGAMMAVYIALLGAYAADKEVRRWIGHEPRSRRGVWFVYAWMVFVLIAFIVQSMLPHYALPEDLVTVALQVLGVFFGTAASKRLYKKKQSTPDTPVPTTEAEQEVHVLAMLETHGELRRTDVEKALQVSKSAAYRILERLEARGLVAQIGESRGTRYVRAHESNE